MKAVTFCLLVLLSVFANVSMAKIEVTEDSRYVYQRIPWYEMVRSDRREVLKEIQEYAINRLGKFVYDVGMKKDENMTSEILLKLHDMKGEDISEMVDDLQILADETAPDGFNISNVVPSAIMVLVGVKFKTTVKVLEGASGTLAFVFVPYVVRKINKATQKVTSEYLNIEPSISFIPVADIGFGTGDGGALKPRYGVGLIWGKIDHAREFKGFTIGASGTVPIMGKNANVKFGTLWKDKKIKNFYATLMRDYSAKPEFSAHGNAGYIFSVADFAGIDIEVTLDQALSYE